MIRKIIFLIAFALIFVVSSKFLFSENPKIREIDYYGLGYAKAQDKKHAVAALIEFEASVRDLYGHLGVKIQKNSASKSLSFFEEMELRYALISSSDLLFEAQKKLLTTLAIPEQEIVSAMLGDFSHSSTGLNVLIAPEFNSFLLGVSDAVGYYVTETPEKIAISGAPPIIFPKLCFADSIEQEEMKIPVEVSIFLKTNGFKDDLTSDLYKTEKSGLVKVIIQKSRSYSMEGIRQSCQKYGEIDKRRSVQRLVLFSEEIKNERYLKKHPEMLPAFAKEIEIHELMHHLTANTCRNLGTREIRINNVLYSQRRINEALASIGSIAVLMSSENEYKSNVLFNDLYFAGSPSYGLTFDLFFTDVFSKIARGEFKKLRLAKKALTFGDIPQYMKLVSRSGPDTLGELVVDGENKFVSAPLVYANFSSEATRLLDVTDSDILASAEAALATILKVQNSICANVPDQSKQD